jgi:hypothetical protein
MLITFKRSLFFRNSTETNGRAKIIKLPLSKVNKNGALNIKIKYIIIFSSDPKNLSLMFAKTNSGEAKKIKTNSTIILFPESLNENGSA